MTKGTATVHGTFFGFLFYGFSRQHLWFKDPEGNKSKVLESNASVCGYRCNNCGVVVLDNATGKDTKADELEQKLSEKKMKWT